MPRIKLWVDDRREPPPGFNFHARNYAEAIACLKTGTVWVLSLDHDLGEEKTAYHIAKWIEEMAFFGEMSRLRWFLHSANPVGASQIRQALINADMYWLQAEVD